MYFIDREIASGKYPNTTTLAQDYECSTATISRDLEYMRDMLDAPIEYDYKERGYYYAKKTFRLPLSHSSPEDLLAFGMAKTLFSLYKNTPIYDAAKRLMDSVIAPLGDAAAGGAAGAASGAGDRWYEDRIIVPPVPLTQFSVNVWEAVCEALRRNLVIDLEYRNKWNDGFFPLRVQPYQLIFDSGAWYLYACTDKKRTLRIYALSRMKNVRLSDKTFTFPAAADHRVRFDGSYFGAYSGEKKYHFRIAFYGDGALRAVERRWTADQQIEETPEGVILSFTSAQYGKVRELVLSNGRDAVPLAPEELVIDWKENLADMRKRAGKEKK